MRILVADDDSDIRNVVGAVLQREGMRVTFAADGAEAIQHLQTRTIDLAILDLMMPRVDGFEVLRHIRSRGIDQPVIFLSARGEETSQVLGLGLGADDYIVKPFSSAALVARVKAHLRRYQALKEREPQAERTITIRELRIDLAACEVSLAGKRIALTAREYELLCFLASHPGQVFTREQLFRQVWGEEYYSDDNTVTVHISRLREKLDCRGGQEQWIQTVRGLGYRFAGDAR